MFVGGLSEVEGGVVSVWWVGVSSSQSHLIPAGVREWFGGGDEGALVGWVDG